MPGADLPTRLWEQCPKWLSERLVSIFPYITPPPPFCNNSFSTSLQLAWLEVAKSRMCLLIRAAHLASGCLRVMAIFTQPLWGPESEKWKWSRSVMSDSLRPHGLYPTRLLSPWNFPGKNTGVGYHFLLQRIFPTHGLNPGLLHCRQTLYHLSHQGSPTTP